MLSQETLFSLRLSLQVATTATILVVIVGMGIAYFLARRQFRGKEFVDMLFTLPLVLPPTVTGYYLIILFGRNGVVGKLFYDWTSWSIMFTWYAAVIAAFVVSLPLMIKTSRAAIESVDITLIQASQVCGHSEWKTAVNVIFPLAKKGLIAGAVLSFARALGEFGATLMIAGNIPGKTNTMPLSIYSQANSGQWAEAHTMVLLLTLMSGAFLYMANRYTRRII